MQFGVIWLFFNSFIVTIAILTLLSQRLSSKIVSVSLMKLVIIVFSVIVMILIGTRDSNVGTDTSTYYLMFNEYISGDKINAKDLGFYYFTLLVSPFGVQYYLFFCALIFMLPIVKLYSGNRTLFLSFLFFLSSFYFLNLGINIMRQGIALSFVLLGLSRFLNDKKRSGLLYCLIAALFHFSVLAIPLAYILAKRLSLRKCIYIYISAIIIAYFGGGILEYVSKLPYLGDIIYSRVSPYIENKDLIGYRTGFRLDFIIFNSFYVLLFVFSPKTNISGAFGVNHDILTKTFILLSSLFFLAFYIPFSDRIGVLSWVLIPLLLSRILNDSTIKYTLLSIILFTLNLLMYIYL